MKKIFILCSAVVLVISLNLYGIEGMALSAQTNSKIQQIFTGTEELGNNNIDTKAMIQNSAIVLDQFGYKYSSQVNGIGTVETIDCDVATMQEKRTGIKGEESDRSETILPFDAVQGYIEEKKLYWLNNDYLNSCVEDVFVNISDESTLISEYKTDAFRVKIYVFTVAEKGADRFEFGKSYSSEIYNIFQIKSDFVWQCFSYKDFDEAEYTSAVVADEDLVCEIQFENCDEQLLNRVINSYEREHE
ncbi:MAG: hypothetical protein K2P42_08130 [Lachnospiraceae bacterium]|nr:hypothetical protein [Lachnospiraceae bacterium]